MILAIGKIVNTKYVHLIIIVTVSALKLLLEVKLLRW